MGYMVYVTPIKFDYENFHRLKRLKEDTFMNIHLNNCIRELTSHCQYFISSDTLSEMNLSTWRRVNKKHIKIDSRNLGK